MDQQRLETLFKNYIAGDLSSEDFHELRQLVQDERYSSMLDGLLRDAYQDKSLREDRDYDPNTVYAELLTRISLPPKRKAALIWRPLHKPNWWLAASVLVLCVVGYIIMDNSKDQGANYDTSHISPGGNSATLTLADGRRIDLSSTHEGIVIGDQIKYVDGTNVIDGRPEDGPHAESLTSHVSHLMSVSTPKGGQYQITLPDGSRVWLNAGSTLKYPMRFSAKERLVELEGEAYFEIRREISDMRYEKRQGRQQSNAMPENLKSHLPFRVMTQEQTVEVLGTQFNVSAYADDPETKTTLVEGAVEIVNLKSADGRTGSKIANKLSPGQQSTLSDNTISIAEVDTEPYIAWKNNEFIFRNEDLRSVMKQIARWYNVTVHYADDAPTGLKIGGMVSRYSDIAVLLDMMAGTGKVNFRIDGKEITVTR